MWEICCAIAPWRYISEDIARRSPELGLLHTVMDAGSRGYPMCSIWSVCCLHNKLYFEGIAGFQDCSLCALPMMAPYISCNCADTPAATNSCLRMWRACLRTAAQLSGVRPPHAKPRLWRTCCGSGMVSAVTLKGSRSRRRG